MKERGYETRLPIYRRMESDADMEVKVRTIFNRHSIGPASSEAAYSADEDDVPASFHTEDRVATSLWFEARRPDAVSRLAALEGSQSSPPRCRQLGASGRRQMSMRWVAATGMPQKLSDHWKRHAVCGSDGSEPCYSGEYRRHPSARQSATSDTDKQLKPFSNFWCRFPESNRGPHHYE
jgi:hypothetical protein